MLIRSGRRLQSPAVAPDVLLYDADCGFCKWAVCKVLERDRGRRLRPMALQADGAAELLPGLSEDERMASWHLVTGSGDVYSGGAALPAVLDRLPRAALLARVFRGFPSATDSGYRWVAAHRTRFGKFTRRRRARSERCIERFAAAKGA
jgi:predicted DCC family thiol-disulfide oxidoreductase YuxK